MRWLTALCSDFGALDYSRLLRKTASLISEEIPNLFTLILLFRTICVVIANSYWSKLLVDWFVNHWVDGTTQSFQSTTAVFIWYSSHWHHSLSSGNSSYCRSLHLTTCSLLCFCRVSGLLSDLIEYIFRPLILNLI